MRFELSCTIPGYAITGSIRFVILGTGRGAAFAHCHAHPAMLFTALAARALRVQVPLWAYKKSETAHSAISLFCPEGDLKPLYLALYIFIIWFYYIC